MQQGFGIILLADEYIRARREAALDIERARQHAPARPAGVRRSPATGRRLSVRLPRLVVTLTFTPAPRSAGTE
jgi:hypothetical protein